MLYKEHSIKKTVLGLLCLIVIFVGLYSYKVIHANQPKFNKELFTGTLLDKPRNIGQFTLQGIDGLEFNNLSLVGNWTIIFFGFTNCGYVCPTTMAELGKMYRSLESQNIKVLPRVVMITLDPERDSLEKLSNYVHAFDRHFYGARGSHAAIDSLTKELGIAYAKVVVKNYNGKKQDDIQHTGAIILFNPQGKLYEFFTGPHNANDIANDLKMLITG